MDFDANGLWVARREPPIRKPEPMLRRPRRSYVFADPHALPIDVIRGAGGGSSPSAPAPPRAPREDRDNLFSNQEGQLVDLLCEGPIEGYATGEAQTSVFLNETPLSQFRVNGVQLLTGEVDQDPIEGFPGAENTTNVGEKLEKSSRPVTRTITDPLTDRVQVNLFTQGLWFQDKKTGDVKRHAVGYSIDVKEDGGVFTRVLSTSLRGKTRTGYGWTRQIDIRDLQKPVQIRVTRRSRPPRSNEASDIFWQSFTEVRDLKLSYPGSALVAIKLRADQFNSIPSRAFKMKLRKVMVPDNYDPSNRTYSGDWHGTFQGPLWTDNPAWCIRDLILDHRGGLGVFMKAGEVDHWALADIARHADELVPSGVKDIFGADVMEHRYSLNLYLQAAEEAYKVIADLSSVMRGQPFWFNGRVTWAQDRPGTPLHHFSQANVVDGNFVYQSSSERARHTVAKTRWNDPDNFYLPTVEYVEDADGIARHGYVIRDVTAIGTTSRGQAFRTGRAILFSEKLQEETVQFKTGLEAMGLLPGMLFNVTDRLRTSSRQGGRVRSASPSRVELDAPVTLEEGKSYDLTIVLPDRKERFQTLASADEVQLPTSPPSLLAAQVSVYADLDQDGNLDTEMTPAEWQPGATDEDPGTLKVVPDLLAPATPTTWEVRYPQGLMTRPIQVPAGGGEFDAVQLTQDFGAVPESGALWVVSEQNAEPRTYYALAVEERDSLEFEVTGLEYSEDKFALIEDFELTDREIEALPPPPAGINPAPTNIAFTQEFRVTQDGTRSILHVAWNHPDLANQRGYKVEVQDDRGIWRSLEGPAQTGLWPNANAFIWDAAPGEYVVRVAAVNAFLKQSATTEARFTLGDLSPIDAVKIVRLETDHDGIFPHWSERDLTVKWGLNAPSIAVAVGDDDPIGESVDFEGEPLTGAGTAIGDHPVPYLKDFVVRVFDPQTPSDGTPLHETTRPIAATGGEFTFRYDTNVETGRVQLSGRRVPRRVVRVEVAARDVYDRLSDFAKLTAEQPPPESPRFFELTATFGSVWVEWEPGGSDPDRLGAIIWASVSGPDFALTKANQVKVDNASPAAFDAPLGGVDYYVRMAVFDSFFPIDDYTEDEVLALLKVTPAQRVTTPFIDGGVDIQELSIGSAQIQEGAIGFLQVADAAIGRAKIRDLSVDTLKLAGNAVSQIQERQLLPFTLLDTWGSPSQKGTWRTVGELPIATAGGPVMLVAFLFAEVVFAWPTFTGEWGVGTPREDPGSEFVNLYTPWTYGQVMPKVRYRVLRDPGPFQQVVFTSGVLSVSITGYVLGGIVSRVDQPPQAGNHVYRYEMQHLDDTYTEGLAEPDGGDARLIHGVGTRWIPNAIPSNWQTPSQSGPSNGSATYNDAEADRFTFLDGNGDPEGTERIVRDVVDDFRVWIHASTGVAVPAGGQPYRMRRVGESVSQLIVDVREGFVQALEMKR